MYKTANKNDKSQQKLFQVRAKISKPSKPLIPPSFYEPHWTDERLINTNLNKGKLVKGRLFFDKSMKDK